MKSKKTDKKIDNNKNTGYNESDDIVIEEELDVNETSRKLRDKLKKCVEEKQEYLEGWQRAKADFINFKKEEEERKIKTLILAKESFVEEILPVLDSLSMSEGSSAWREGLEQINKQLISILEKNGLRELNPQNEDFDPNLHEAIEMIEGDKKSEGKIVEVTQKGYLLNNKIIRPARVKVGK